MNFKGELFLSMWHKSDMLLGLLSIFAYIVLYVITYKGQYSTNMILLCTNRSLQGKQFII